MESLSQKIRTFLADAGFDFNGDRCSNLQLLHYFEKEYGLEMMRLLETEWVEEQVERDLNSGLFMEMRTHVEDDRLDDFDADVRSLRDRAA